MTLTDAQQQVVEALDHDAVVAFLARLVETPSPTGSEEQAAVVVAEYLNSTSAQVELQRFAPGRANVVARLPGRGGGSSIMLNGHLDTSYTGEEPELDGPGYKNQAVLVDGTWMYGNGVHNMKSAVAAFAEVIAAIERSKVPFAGDVVLAGVAGEIEKAPYGRYQGAAYDGFGAGTAHALRHGLHADMCILGEPTALTVGLSNLGVVWVRLGVSGTMAHTQHASEAVNAIEGARRLMDRLDPWMESYRDRHAYQDLRPAADVTAIEGGWPYRVSRTPVFCDVFVCLRVPPTTTPTQVIDELGRYVETLIPEVGTVEVEAYVSHPAAVIEADQPVVTALHRSHTAIAHAEPVYRPRGAYMDSSHLVALGIPTVIYGPSGRVRAENPDAGWSPDLGEHTNLEDLRTYTQVVAATVTQLCAET